MLHCAKCQLVSSPRESALKGDLRKDSYLVLYYGLRDYENSIRLYEQSLAFAGSSFETYFNRGLGYYRLGNRAAAVDAFASAKALETTGAKAEAWLKKLA